MGGREGGNDTSPIGYRRGSHDYNSFLPLLYPGLTCVHRPDPIPSTGCQSCVSRLRDYTGLLRALPLHPSSFSETPILIQHTQSSYVADAVRIFVRAVSVPGNYSAIGCLARSAPCHLALNSSCTDQVPHFASIALGTCMSTRRKYERSTASGRIDIEATGFYIASLQ